MNAKTIGDITVLIVTALALILGTLGYMKVSNDLNDLSNGHYETFSNGEVVHMNSHGLSDEVQLICPAPDPTSVPTAPNQG